MRLHLGQHFAARFRLEEELGRGGAGAVYLAWDAARDERVALKILHPDTPVADLSWFAREAEVLADLRHPNTLEGLDCDLDTERPWHTTRVVRGGTLEDLVSAGPLSPAETVELAAGVCAALEALHGRGWVHGDVKPSNVLVQPTADGGRRAILADFGLLRQVGCQDGASLMAGSPISISPEVLLGDPVDARTDIFAVGVVVHFALTGEPPFRGSDIAALRARLHSRGPRPDADGWLDPLHALAWQCLHCDPAYRPPTAAGLARHLRARAA